MGSKAQWGKTESFSSTATLDITLPVSFASECYSAVGTNAADTENAIAIKTVSKTKITIKRVWAGSNHGSGAVYWLAVGK
ncbi:MAG: hypothetical protein IJV12_00570 [Acidaminococcaceae bacterium]|nr:hypothetical protein [Acidaminococcaceae bacterium]